jgi:hypothetical protein
MVAALTVASWPTTARIVRGQVVTLKQNDYVNAARAIGARWHRILLRHLLPNSLGVLVIAVFLDLPAVVLGEAFLSFIGLGINPPNGIVGLDRPGRPGGLRRSSHGHRRAQPRHRNLGALCELHRRRPPRCARPTHSRQRLK